jgi:hydrogenase small subunit
MRITRRDLMKYAGASAAALGLSGVELAQAAEVLASSTSPAVIWLSGSGCTGCSVSLLNAVNPTIDQVLLNTISLKYHADLMGAAGDLAVAAANSAANAGGHILVLEGAIPTGAAGRYCAVWSENGRSVTAAEAVTKMAAKAKYLVAVGTCAAFGGIPRVAGATGALGLGAYLGKPVINLPGCPAHPDWVVLSLVSLIAGKVPALDSKRRPTLFYTTQTVHERCPRRETEEASQFGQRGRCLEELGCKGPSSHCDCDIRLWNNKQSYCISANVGGLCIGCTEANFPAFPLHRDED